MIRNRIFFAIRRAVEGMSLIGAAGLMSWFVNSFHVGILVRTPDFASFVMTIVGACIMMLMDVNFPAGSSISNSGVIA